MRRFNATSSESCGIGDGSCGIRDGNGQLAALLGPRNARKGTKLPEFMVPEMVLVVSEMLVPGCKPRQYLVCGPPSLYYYIGLRIYLGDLTYRLCKWKMQSFPERKSSILGGCAFCPRPTHRPPVHNTETSVAQW